MEKEKPNVQHFQLTDDISQVVEDYRQDNYQYLDILKDQMREVEELSHFGNFMSPANITTFTLVDYRSEKKIVRMLSKNDFIKLLTSRNRNLILPSEQRKVSQFKVAIAGMSVGSNICQTIVMQGGGMSGMVIADNDLLSTSNLNRVHGSILDVGQQKVGVMAKKVYGINPYVRLKCLFGIDSHNIDKFVKNADIVFDEIDNIPLKIKLRLRAKKYRKPLVMITDNGDNVMVDVERFDKDLHLLPFHGLLTDQELRQIDRQKGDLSPKRRVELALKIIQPQNAVPRMQESLLEVGKSINTWPQLATASFLAGIVGSYIMRKIALDEPVISGRAHISLDSVLIKNYNSKANIAKRQKKTKSFLQSLNIEGA